MASNGARSSSGLCALTLLLLAASVGGDSKWVWGGNARAINDNNRGERLRDREVVETPLTQPLFKPAPDYQPDRPNYRPPGRYEQGLRNDFGPQTFNNPNRPRPLPPTKPPFRFEQPNNRPQSDPFPRPGGFGRPGIFQPGPNEGGPGGYPRPPLGGVGPNNGGDFPDRPYGGPGGPGGPGGFGSGGIGPGGIGPGGIGPGGIGPGGIGQGGFGPGGIGPGGIGPGGIGPGGFGPGGIGPGGIGPGGPGGFGNGIGGPRPGGRPDILTGPVPSWEQRPGPRPFHGYDTCKCAHSFNCISPGIQFGHCDAGKTYCCYNSGHVGGVNHHEGPGGPGGPIRPGRPVLTGPGGPVDGPLGPGGPIGGPGGPDAYGGRPVLVGPGGPTGVIGPNGPRPPLPFGDRFNGDGNGIYPVDTFEPLQLGRSSDAKTPAKIKK